MEWIDTGTLMERINFASEQLGDISKPGVMAMVDSIVADGRERRSLGDDGEPMP